MSILDEDKSLFDANAENSARGRIAGRYPGVRLVIKCKYDIGGTGDACTHDACTQCIGRKYNVSINGCPICGSKLIHDVTDTLVRRCSVCETIMIGCGMHDISALVYLPLSVPETEDII